MKNARWVVPLFATLLLCGTQLADGSRSGGGFGGRTSTGSHSTSGYSRPSSRPSNSIRTPSSRPPPTPPRTPTSTYRAPPYRPPYRPPTHRAEVPSAFVTPTPSPIVTTSVSPVPTSDAVWLKLIFAALLVGLITVAVRRFLIARRTAQLNTPAPSLRRVRDVEELVPDAEIGTDRR
ncbi:hypothetical protein [Deinococcus ruber]|uniref:hypothetical protein n=1 Tax=Deinococcus ruber TaxID=1848197 RepID=UPI00166A4A8C|nr:hypothetical protein [Deinococcus ruber]